MPLLVAILLSFLPYVDSPVDDGAQEKPAKQYPKLVAMGLNLWADYTYFYFKNRGKEFHRGSGVVNLSQNGGFSTFKVNLALNYRF